jgi:hypothetical protein
MNEKKVILFIVEGPSDEAALGTIMEEYFNNEDIKFLVVHGDITIKNFITKDNAIIKINEQVEKKLEELEKKYNYSKTDYVKIIHLIDTDGTYIPDDKVIQKIMQEEGEDNNKSKSKVLYYEDHIEAENVRWIRKRNAKKADVLFKLRTTKKINGIQYCVYYNSCNLEHVLYKELKDFTDDEKLEMSDDFAEKYEGKVEEFIKFISDKSVAVEGSYKETWEYIEKDLNSLNRHSNMNLIFEGE